MADAVLAARRDTTGEDDPDALQTCTRDLGEVIDEDTRLACQRKCEELRACLDQAVADGAEDAAERYRDEIKKITNYLKGAQGLGGRSRRVSDAVKNANDAVRNSINRALADLAKAHPPLREHLRQFLALGTHYCYSPRPAVDWDV